MNKTLLKLAVLSVSLLSMGATAVSPAIANISAAFKDSSPQTIMLLVSLPSITMVVVSLMFGKLAEFMGRRTLFFIAIALFLVGGVAPYFLNDMTAILIMRSILGAGLGISIPLATILVPDFFNGPERATVMGLQSVFVSIGGIIWAMLGGLLCTISWQHTFLAYLFAILVFLFVLFCLPEPAKIQQGAGNGTLAEKVPLGWQVYLLQGTYFVYALLIMVFFTNAAIQVAGEKIGDAASAGLALMAFTIGGLVTGFFFGKIMQALKNFTISVGWLITGAGIIIFSSVHDFNLILVGSFLAGIGFSVTCPAIFVTLSTIVPKSRVATSIAVAFSLGGIGQFIAPVIFEFISFQLGHGPGRFSLFVSAIVFLAVGLLLTLQNIARSPKVMNVKS
ncbi:MAG TPA: MFS transporter [Negativicutes bacterium]|jgi:MFS family permease